MDAARRRFLQTTGRLGSVAGVLSLGACLSSSVGKAVPGSPPGSAYPFTLGVASGSPLPDAVVIWTRLLTDPLDAAAMPPLAMAVRWEMAGDEGFRQIVASGSAIAAPELAHSVHVDVRGLQPGRWYWYRFMLGDAVSPVGRTRTAPSPGELPASLKLAVASCQHWEFGSYAAHRHIAAAAPDLVAFLGDYIYEWGPYQLQHPASAVRTAESFSLAQYRARYAQYKSDPDLQAAHLAAPWIVTWDDHEVANDYGADRDERLSPDFLQRRAAAYQAFYEHMPLRVPPELGRGMRSFADMRVYERYDWGRLARFHVLDDRQYRAHHACPKPGRGGSNSVTARECAALLDPGRSMLGGAQEAWLAEGLRKSPARWNILAQQTLMAQATQTPAGRDEPEAIGGGRFWTDGWDGYPMARRQLFDTLRASGASNPLVLSGDVHTFYASDLRPDPLQPVGAGNPVVATEFCGTSVTSSSRPQSRTERYLADNPHILYGRSDKRGFMLLDVRPQQTTTLFIGLDNVHDVRSKAATLARFTVEDGKPGALKS
jgi:alkaline phosphatase D